VARIREGPKKGLYDPVPLNLSSELPRAPPPPPPFLFRPSITPQPPRR